MKFGRKPPVYNRRTFRNGLVLAKALDPLGPAPTSCPNFIAAVESAVGGRDQWGMMGNDVAGCCTISSTGHRIMLTTANAGPQIVIPTRDDVLNLYKQLSGWNGVPDDPSDTGLDETTVCQFDITTGLLGQKSSGTAMVDPGNLDHVKWTVAMFGACRLGIVVTQGMMDQFGAGQAWDGTGDPTPLGGHDVPFVYYRDDESGGDIITWGRRHPFTWDWWTKQTVEEVHAELFLGWADAVGSTPANLDMTLLQEQLTAVAT